MFPYGKCVYDPGTVSENHRLAVSHLQRQPVSDHGDEFAIRRFTLGIAHRVAEVLLQRLQVTPVPGHLNGVADLLPCS